MDRSHHFSIQYCGFLQRLPSITNEMVCIQLNVYCCTLQENIMDSSILIWPLQDMCVCVCEYERECGGSFCLFIQLLHRHHSSFQFLLFAMIFYFTFFYFRWFFSMFFVSMYRMSFCSESFFFVVYPLFVCFSGIITLQNFKVWQNNKI